MPEKVSKVSKRIFFKYLKLNNCLFNWALKNQHLFKKGIFKFCHLLFFLSIRSFKTGFFLQLFFFPWFNAERDDVNSDVHMYFLVFLFLSITYSHTANRLHFAAKREKAGKAYRCVYKLTTWFHRLKKIIILLCCLQSDSPSGGKAL